MKWLLLSLFLVVGCGTNSSDRASLPRGAYNIKNLGNGWSSFELSGYRFLYHKAWNGYKGYEAITQIKD